MKINGILETRKELKEALKEAAVEIKKMKAQRKGAMYGRVPGLDSLRYEVRHHHLAYCLARGTDRYDIEAKCRDDNKPDMDYVRRIMKPVLIHWEEMKRQEAVANV